MVIRDYNVKTIPSSFFFFFLHFIYPAPLESYPPPFSLSSSVSSHLHNAFTRYWANKSRARGCYPGREGVPVGAGWLAGCCSRVHWPTSACCWVERSSLPFSRCREPFANEFANKDWKKMNYLCVPPIRH